MPIRRTGAIALSTLVLAGTAAVATQSTAEAAPAPTHGIAHLNTQVNLPNGVWTDVPLQVVLPHAGTYDLDADVRGRLAVTPAANSFITARLWNVTAGAEVPLSERQVYQIIDLNTGTAQAGGNETAPIEEQITVSGPTTIMLQALRTDAVGHASIAQIYSDGFGRTSLRFNRIGA